MMRLRIPLADDHSILLQGMQGLLERENSEVIGLAAEGRQAVALAEKLKPDVAILDIDETAGLVRYAIRRGVVQP